MMVQSIPSPSEAVWIESLRIDTANQILSLIVWTYEVVFAAASTCFLNQGRPEKLPSHPTPSAKRGEPT